MVTRKDLGTELKKNGFVSKSLCFVDGKIDAAIQGFDEGSEFHMVLPEFFVGFLGLNPERMMMTGRVTCRANKTLRILKDRFVNIDLISLCDPETGDGGEVYIPINCFISNR